MNKSAQPFSSVNYSFGSWAQNLLSPDGCQGYPRAIGIREFSAHATSFGSKCFFFSPIAPQLWTICWGMFVPHSPKKALGTILEFWQCLLLQDIKEPQIYNLLCYTQLSSVWPPQSKNFRPWYWVGRVWTLWTMIKWSHSSRSAMLKLLQWWGIKCLPWTLPVSPRETYSIFWKLVRIAPL
jgi:hypothetical protein